MLRKQVLGYVLALSGLSTGVVFSAPAEGADQRYYVCYKDIWAAPNSEHAVQHYRQCTFYSWYTEAANHPRFMCPKYNAYRYHVFATRQERDQWRSDNCDRWHYQ